MKITVFDPWRFKFSQQIIDHWKDQGHEVRQSVYVKDTDDISWADVVYFEVIDNNLITYCRDWADIRPKKKVIVRGVDIDLWVRNPRHVNFDLVDDLILLNEYSKEILKGYMELPNTNIHVIPCGVDLDKWTYKKRDGQGTHLAFVGDMWLGKNPAKAIEILHEVLKLAPNKDWKLSLVGSLGHLRNGEPWWLKHMQHITKKYGLENRVTFVDEFIEDLNVFYDTVDFLLVTSFKEQFSYVTGEAMSKGIKPVIHDFWDAQQIWPKDLIYLTPSEAARIVVEGPYQSRRYRNYVEKNYSLKSQLEAYDALIND